MAEIGADGVVVVGAGQAGFQLAVSLREGGYEGKIRLIGVESGLPYERPPLSKGFLIGDGNPDKLRFKPGAFFAEKRIDLIDGVRVAAIDRTARQIRFADGRGLGYGHLVLATGASNRRLPVPGADLAGVVSLRGIADSQALRAGLQSGGELVVVGAGFLGLETAAVAAKLGLPVHVIEATRTPMGRAISAEVSRAFTTRHERAGVRFSLGMGVARLLGEGGAVTGVETSDGAILPARLVLVAIGVRPDIELAEAAGLAVGNGIVVDGLLSTEDPMISAIGDCALYPSPFAAGAVRLESVQNAVDHGRCLAATLLGRPVAYAAVPWFWSDQDDWKLQIAGLAAGCTETVRRGEDGAFSVFCFREGMLTAVESVNRPAEHIAARKLLEAGGAMTQEEAADPGFDLRARAAAARRRG